MAAAWAATFGFADVAEAATDFAALTVVVALTLAFAACLVGFFGFFAAEDTAFFAAACDADLEAV